MSVGLLAATPAVAAGHGCHAHCSQPIRRSLAEVEGRKRKSSDRSQYVSRALDSLTEDTD